MKKRIFLVILLGILAGVEAHAQDVGGPQVLYIPGMPAPPVATSPQEAAPSAAGSVTGQGQGKISKVTRAGQLNESPAPRAPVAPVPHASAAPYKGVVPPTHTVPENAAIFADANNQLSWLGFMIEGGAHKVFVQTTQSASYTQQSNNPREIVLLLRDVGAKVANNRRNLDMRYFKTVFKSAQAQRAGRDLRVVIELTEAVPYEVSQSGNIISVVVGGTK